jgi:hypothetical protein
MVDQAGFKDDHLCFAKASNESMAVFDKILELPLKNKTKPNDMNGEPCLLGGLLPTIAYSKAYCLCMMLC